MIRIRCIDPPVSLVELLKTRQWAELTSDPHVVVSEQEKNSGRSATGVNDVLRERIAEMWRDQAQPFSLVSVETRSGCNHECSFCPVSKSHDPRTPGVMGLELLDKVARELKELNFSGRLSLFGNNEPLLDDRLVEIVGFYRSHLQAADLRILTNGTKITVGDTRALFDAGLSTLIVNNYTDGRKLIGPVRSLIEADAELADCDIRVSVRDRLSVLTTRAGMAPNKPVPEVAPKGFCALPFTDLHISYTGDVNQCCFDAYGQTSMGNVTDERLIDIWSSQAFNPLRASLLESRRSGLSLCDKCDFDGFREPQVGREPPLVRQDLVLGDTGG